MSEITSEELRDLRAKATRGLALAEHARLSGELLGNEGTDGGEHG